MYGWMDGGIGRWRQRYDADYLKVAGRHGLGPGHPMEVYGFEADEVDVLSGHLLHDPLHVI